MVGSVEYFKDLKQDVKCHLILELIHILLNNGA